MHQRHTHSQKNYSLQLKSHFNFLTHLAMSAQLLVALRPAVRHLGLQNWKWNFVKASCSSGKPWFILISEQISISSGAVHRQNWRIRTLLHTSSLCDFTAHKQRIRTLLHTSSLCDSARRPASSVSTAANKLENWAETDGLPFLHASHSQFLLSIFSGGGGT